MGGACSLYGRGEKYIQNFSRETWREETTWDLVTHGRIILKCILLTVNAEDLCSWHYIYIFLSLSFKFQLCLLASAQNLLYDVITETYCMFRIWSSYSSDLKNRPSVHWGVSTQSLVEVHWPFRGMNCLILAGYLLGSLFDPEDGGSTFLQSISELLPDYMAHVPEGNTLHSVNV
jgi:hypothetical protein